MKIKQISDYLLNKYPLKNKEIWDPAGFSIKFNLSQKLTGIVTSIDLTKEVLNKAIQTNSNLIITHHPFKFEKTWKDEQLKAPYKLEILSMLKKHKISVLCLHTNYDYALEGTSFQIIKSLKLDNFAIYQEFGYEAKISFKTTTNDLISLIKNNLKLSEFRTNLSSTKLNKEISKIAFLSGSGYIGQAIELANKGYELIVTSDIKWSDWIVYDQNKINILEIPHLDEEVFAKDIFEQLKNKFNNLNIHFVKLSVPYKNI
ncbi:Nif3-like dinuclear metal center hexameric protein [Mycoplasmopsis alligatoris]|uniref:GTP cyclohydrolase 1 type 2 homolog n=1 Tax=Mycoplasmopsis alligatoris A21JP2 TaxID=747682 RepID=D4XVS0_9BACT|nr:Nif3-like dinuclear metal center hexameric protein [Mycoplasmopsis alligatoris]EFF41555.1 dinuclear metal center protein, YbgI family [Mycoplasmopsis alligatoris A21JP2]